RRGIGSAIALEQDPHGLGELSLTVAEGILRCFGQLHQFLRIGILASFTVAECQRQLEAGDFSGSLCRFTSLHGISSEEGSVCVLTNSLRTSSVRARTATPGRDEREAIVEYRRAKTNCPRSASASATSS